MISLEILRSFQEKRNIKALLRNHVCLTKSCLVNNRIFSGYSLVTVVLSPPNITHNKNETQTEPGSLSEMERMGCLARANGQILQTLLAETPKQQPDFQEASSTLNLEGLFKTLSQSPGFIQHLGATKWSHSVSCAAL